MIRFCWMVGMALTIVPCWPHAAHCEPVEPALAVKAAKVFNSTGYRVGFDYRFEDDNVRQGEIGAQSAVYIYDANPKYPLKVRLRTTTLGRSYELKTELVTTDLQGAPDLKRNDEAHPYHIALNSDGQLAVYEGFPDVWVRDVAARVFERVKQSNIDVDVLVKELDSSKADVLGPTLEFAGVREILSEEYCRQMRTSDMPNLSIEWTQPSGANSEMYSPRLVVCGCNNPTTQSFLTSTMEKLFREKIKWSDVRIVQMCCAAMTVKVADLNPTYVKGNEVDMAGLVHDVANHLTSSSDLQSDHIDEMGTNHRRINTAWRYFNEHSYRYKLLIDIKVVKSDQATYGVEFESLLVSQKRVGKSDRWSRLSDLAIYELGSNLHDTMAQDQSIPKPNSSKTLKTDDSFVVKYCRDLSKELSGIVTNQTKKAP